MTNFWSCLKGVFAKKENVRRAHTSIVKSLNWKDSMKFPPELALQANLQKDMRLAYSQKQEAIENRKIPSKLQSLKDSAKKQIPVVDKVQNDFVGIREASDLLGVCEYTLRVWDRTGKFKALRSKSGWRFYRRQQINDLLKSIKPYKRAEFNTVQPKKEKQKYSSEDDFIKKEFCEVKEDSLTKKYHWYLLLDAANEKVYPDRYNGWYQSIAKKISMENRSDDGKQFWSRPELQIISELLAGKQVSGWKLIKIDIDNEHLHVCVVHSELFYALPSKVKKRKKESMYA